MNIIKAKNIHLISIMAVIEKAKVFMAPQGSGQWQDGNPSLSTIKTDIEKGQYFVCVENGIVLGGFAFFDHDEDYLSLLEGQWLNEQPYKVIHRLAVDPSIHGRGIGSFLLLNAETMALKQKVTNIRVDTHELNIPMISLLKKNGYIQTGVCMLGKTKRRIVFQKCLQPR